MNPDDPTEVRGQAPQCASGLKIRQLCAWHEEDGTHETPVFLGVSWDLAAGEILGVAGPNGAGKTTLLRSICGLHEWYTGDASIDDQPVHNQHVGLVPQTYVESFFPWASLRTNIRMLTNISFGDLDELLAEFGLTLNLALRPSQCSGGMVQQAAIIRALAGDSKLFLADEPFSSLDSRVAAGIRKSLRSHIQARRIPAVIISHDLLSLVELCDKILVIPGTPYSTVELAGYETATVIENKSDLLEGIKTRAGGSSAPKDTLVDVVERLMGGDR